MDLEDISVKTIRVDTAALGFTNADNAVFSLNTATTFVADVADPDDGGTYTVNVNVDNVTSLTTAAATNSAADKVNHTGVTVNLNGTSTIDSIALMTVGGLTNVNVLGSKFTIDALAEANTSAVAKIAGSQTLTITKAENTTIDASSYSGAITLTNAHTTAADVKTGAGADVVTVDAAADATNQNYELGAGNDTLDVSAYTGGATVGIFAAGGVGNDTFVVGSAATKFAATAGSLVFDGGEGTDIIDINTESFDFNVDLTGMAIASIEEIQIAAAAKAAAPTTFGTSTFHNQSVTFTGSTANFEDVTLVSGATAASTNIDLSKVTFAASIDNVAIDLSTALTTDAAVTAVLSNRGETVTGSATAKGFTLNLAGGDDTITLSAAAAGGGAGGTLTLGAGADTVTFAAGASVSAVGDLVSITDFNEAADKITSVSGVVAAKIDSAAAIDVSAVTTTIATDSISAYVSNGMVKLLNDAKNINSLDLWIDVVEAVSAGAGGTASGVHGFEFNGDTYIVETDTSVESVTVRLVGVTGVNLALGGGGLGIIEVS
jgi:hypothetical protein